NLLSLAEGWSDKDPAQCIGHKGLGFRAVLGVTPSPYVIKPGNGFLALKFSWALNNGHVQETLKLDPTLVAEYDRWTRFDRSACPIMYIPGRITKPQGLGDGRIILDRLNRSLYGGPYSTLFWMPARDPDISSVALRSLHPTPLIGDADGQELLI